MKLWNYILLLLVFTLLFPAIGYSQHLKQQISRYGFSHQNSMNTNHLIHVQVDEFFMQAQFGMVSEFTLGVDKKRWRGEILSRHYSIGTTLLWREPVGESMLLLFEGRTRFRHEERPPLEPSNHHSLGLGLSFSGEGTQNRYTLWLKRRFDRPSWMLMAEIDQSLLSPFRMNLNGSLNHHSHWAVSPKLFIGSVVYVFGMVTNNFSYTGHRVVQLGLGIQIRQ